MTNGEIQAVVVGLSECRARQYAALVKVLGSEEAAAARMDEIQKRFVDAGEGVVDTEMFIFAATLCIEMLREKVLKPAQEDQGKGLRLSTTSDGQDE